MSAIAGFWAFASGADPSARCRDMLAALADCGTHGSAAAQKEGLALGRNLFPLVPEDRFDRQPLLSDDGGAALVADARLDNRDELGSALGLTAAETAGMADSTLLFLALRSWGEEALDRLLGDFAFAFHDAERQRLILARDPLGQRPLFWHRTPSFFAFASMPRALHALGVPRRPDTDTAARYLALLHPVGARSWFEGIQRVQPGHVVTVLRDTLTCRRYWRPERRELRLGGFEAHAEAFRAELDAAVARRLRRCEGPAAAHLSGGWDSGAVAATAAQLLRPAGERLIALTAIPATPAAEAPQRRFVDEGPLAGATARLHPNIDHILVPSSGRSPLADLDRYAELFERPLFNPCNHVWLADLRRAARERGARILLTGEIGNWTISAGPPTVLADLMRQRRWAAWLRETWALASTRRARLRGIAASSFGPWLPPRLWKTFSRLSSAPDMALQTALRPELRAGLSADQPGLLGGVPRAPADTFENTAQALMEMDFGEYRKGVLAGWGIDKRDATADRRLIEFCLSLPLDMLMHRGMRRPLARGALADRLPAEVLDERRKGYQAPDWHEALTADLPRIRTMIAAIDADSTARTIIDVDFLRDLVRDWPRGGWHRPQTIARYRVALLQGLAAGHFLLAASGSGR